MVVTGTGFEAFKFNVLAGFAWKVGRDGNGDPSASIVLGPVPIDVGHLNTSLENAGFRSSSGWEAITGYNLVPEPSTLSMTGISLLMVVLRRRQSGKSKADRARRS